MVDLDWSTKRRIVYLSIITAVLILLISVLSFFVFYKKPTCFDGSKNQNEAGIDCGGTCTKLCTNQVSDLKILWAKPFKINDDFYSVAALVENPNINSVSDSVEYIFKLKNSFGEVIAERRGKTSIPNSRILAIFESDFRLTEEVKSVDFEFLGNSVWYREDQEPVDIDIKKTDLTRIDYSPRLEVSLENKSFGSVSRLEITALVFDGKGEVIAVSRTFLDGFRSGSVEDIVFTWPEAFPVTEKVCQVPVDIALILDRSGSMAADSLEPPQPLTQVKNAASTFVDAISEQDSVSIISFATTASKPIDLFLEKNKNFIKKAIEGIKILDEGGTQYTNTSDALNQAFLELKSDRQRKNAEKVIILLTDGEKPNRPEKEGQQDYPVTLAFSKATEIKSDNIEIFTIGLGAQFDGGFLQSISTNPSHYYNAPEASDLENIYKEIATKICKEGPTTIDIITREIK